MSGFYFKDYTLSEHPKKNNKYFMKRNSYFEGIRPLLIVYQIIGRIPFDIMRYELRPFSLFSFSFAYSSLIYISLCHLSIHSINSIHEKYSSEEKLNISLAPAIYGFFASFNFIIPLTDWIGAYKIYKYTRLWNFFQRRFIKKNFKLRTDLFVKVLAITSIPFMLSLLHSILHATSGLSLDVTLTYILLSLSATYGNALWALTLHEIKVIAEKLCENILADQLHDLERKRQMWVLLTKLCTETGNTFSLQLLPYFLGYFGVMVLCTYNILNDLRSPEINLYSQLGRLSMISYGMTFFCVISFRAQKTTETLIHFLETIRRNKPRVDLFGLLPVNKSLIVSCYTSTLSYIIVLLQYQTGISNNTSKIVYLNRSVIT